MTPSQNNENLQKESAKKAQSRSAADALENSEKAEKAAKDEKTVRPEQTEEADKTDKAENAEKTDKTEKSEKADRSKKSGLVIDLGRVDPDKEELDKRKKAKKRRLTPKQRRKRRIIMIVSIVLAIVLTAVMTLMILITDGRRQLIRNHDAIVTLPDIPDVAPENDGKTIEYKGKTYKLNENITSILCMGIDKDNLNDASGFGGNGQADANFLLTIDTKTGKMCAIAINRDTMIDAGVYSESGDYLGAQRQQLCLVYANGDGKKQSCENMMEAVSELFYGIPVSTYMAIDLNAIGILNNAVGGVTVTSPHTFTGKGASFTKGETVTINDATRAISFVGYRDVTRLNSNAERMERQKIYLKAFAKKAIAKTKENITFPLSLYNQTADYNINNLNASKITYLTSCVIGGMKNVNLEFLNVEGETVQGEEFAEFTPDSQKLFELILKVYYNEVK